MENPAASSSDDIEKDPARSRTQRADIHLLCALSSANDEELTILKRIKYFFKTCWPGITCVVVPLIFIPMLLPFPPEKYQWCAYILVLMAAFWVTECIPLAITSFLPVALFPITGIMDTLTTCKCYMNDTILMFIGSLMLACAVEQSGLHKRLALAAIRAIGYSHYRLLFAMSFITMFVSMWITNTAATTMMVPINFAILTVFQEQNLLSIYEVDSGGEIVASDITTCYFCAATYSATIGGIGTLVGTATNLVFKGLFTSAYPNAPEYLSFPKFSAFAVPYIIIMEICTYLAMIIIYLGFLRPKSEEAKFTQIPPEGLAATKQAVEDAWEKLGKITFWEIMVAVLFSSAIVMFFCRAPQIFKGWGNRISDSLNLHDEQYVLDSAAAFLVVLVMFLLPSVLDFFNYFRPSCGKEQWPQQTIPSIINYFIMNENLSYNFMFLLGGGFALSKAANKKYTDLNGRIGDILKSLRIFPNSAILLFIIIFTVFVTNFASNVAVCNVIAPIAMQLASELGHNPLWYAITAGISASYCFCLPVGTPGNLVVQSAASIPTFKMVKAGIAPTFLIIIVSWLCLYLWAPVIWPVLKDGSPSWLNTTIVPES